MTIKPISIFAAMAATLITGGAHAYDIEFDRYGFHVSGHGGFGIIGTDLETKEFPSYLLRAAADYRLSIDRKIGVVYSIDSLAVKTKHFARDAFVYTEDSALGRIETGYTDSIVAKLGIGIPDVGGLRLNDYSRIYEHVDLASPVIANMMTYGTKYSFRVNAATSPRNAVQYAVSVSPVSEHFNYAADIGLKYRKPFGKTKLAVSFGASYIENPHDLASDIFMPIVNSDWRAQATVGLNLQYNSWIWGTSVRAIYDHNPIGLLSDGIAAGTGVSYDFLNLSASVSYIFSDIGTFQDSDLTDYKSNDVHTGILSLRYKFNKYVSIWGSAGATISYTTSPFASAGLRINF